MKPSPPRCASCAHFCNQPQQLERALPGLNTMSSAHASVRASDGICRLLDRYLGPNAHCASHTIRIISG